MFDQITMSHRTFSLTLAAVTGERRKVISGSPLVSGSCPLFCTAENTSCASMVVNSGSLVTPRLPTMAFSATEVSTMPLSSK